MVMSAVDVVMWSLHTAFAGAWTGSVLFFFAAVLPAASRGSIDGPTLSAIATKLRWLTRAGVVVFVATGGHMAGTRYTFDSLLGTGRGHLVLTMLVLWFVLTALVEIGGSRIESADSNGQDAAAAGRPIFLVAGIVALGLLIDAGLLASGQIV